MPGKGYAGIAVLILLTLASYAFAGSISGTVTVFEKMSVPSISIFNTIIDQGQSILFTANVIGGTSPFIYNYQVINTVSGTIVANMLVSNSYNSNSFIWVPSYQFAGNTIKANVIITDAVSNTLASSYSLTANINEAPIITITPSENTIPSGNTLTYTINEMYGTGPFTVEIYGVSDGLKHGSNAIIQLQGSNTITFTATHPSTATLLYNAIATDLGTTSPYTFNSISNAIEIINNSGSITVQHNGGPAPPPPIKPTTETLANGCMLVTNVTVPSSFNVQLNGSVVTVTDSYISTNYTDIIANGRVYVLYEGVNTNIDGTSIRIELLNTSYTQEPYKASFKACSTGVTTTSIPVSIPKLSFTSFPVYTELVKGTSASLQLGLYDPTKSQEYVNVSVLDGLANVITFSTNKVQLHPGSGVGIGIVLTANPSLGLGSHVIPIQMRISGPGIASTTQTAFITLAVLNSSPDEPVILNQLSMVNYTGSNGTTAMGTITIKSPANSSIINASLETILPESLVHSASQVSTYGIPANVTMQGGSYVIIWHVPYLQKNTTTYSYYRIGNPVQQLAPLIRNILVVPLSGPLKLNNVLNVYNISVPVFYSKQTNYVTVHALYTGSGEGNVSLTLKASNGISIANSTRNLKTTPNQNIEESFPIETPGSAGTMTLTLDIAANGATTEYTIPVVVQQRPVQITFLLQLFAGISIIAIITIVALLAKAGIGGTSRKGDTSGKLKSIKRQLGGVD